MASDNRRRLKYAEAVHLFMDAGFSETTFRRKVQEFPVDHILPLGRARGALYLESDVRAALEESRKENLQQEEKSKQEDVLIDWSGALDAAAGLRLSQQLYGPDVDIAELAIYQSWRKNNNQLTLCAFSLDRRECFAELQVLPLAEPLIEDILRGKRKESSIRPDEIRNYEGPGPYSLIVTNAVTLPERPELLLRLLLRYMDFWVEQYPDRYIKRVYTQAVSERGFMLVQHFFMTPRFDLNFNAYMIDLAYPSASRIVRHFKRKLEKKAPLLDELRWSPNGLEGKSETAI
jgi:hypothetical protein